MRAAFRACGCRKALTPFEIASTPVRALDPEAKARRTANSVIAPAPTGSWSGTTAVGHVPTVQRATPVSISASIARMNA